MKLRHNLEKHNKPSKNSNQESFANIKIYVNMNNKLIDNIKANKVKPNIKAKEEFFKEKTNTAIQHNNLKLYLANVPKLTNPSFAQIQNNVKFPINSNPTARSDYRKLPFSKTQYIKFKSSISGKILDNYQILNRKLIIKNTPAIISKQTKPNQKLANNIYLSSNESVNSFSTNDQRTTSNRNIQQNYLIKTSNFNQIFDLKNQKLKSLKLHSNDIIFNSQKPSSTTSTNTYSNSSMKIINFKLNSGNVANKLTNTYENIIQATNQPKNQITSNIKTANIKYKPEINHINPEDLHVKYVVLYSKISKEKLCYLETK